MVGLKRQLLIVASVLGLFPHGAQGASLTLAWDPSASATGYLVLVGTSSGAYGTQINVGAVTTFAVPGLTDNTTYFFAVEAYDGAGASAPSAEISATTPAPGVTPPTYLGFTGNGTTALIWQRADGPLQAWDLTGATATLSQALTPGAVADANWKVVGSADFNNDGYPDLLFQHATTGQLAAWFMKGTTMASAALLSPVGPTDPNWKVVALADFNGDGRPDLLFQHTSGALAVWYMNGSTMVGATMLSPVGPVDPAWRVVAAADFNRDGKPDLLFQHATTGGLALWYMNGVQLSNPVLLSPAGPSDPNWKIAGVSDFDGDGQQDLLFQHAITKQLVVWYMHGATMASGGWFTPTGLSDPTWKVVAVR